jgi:hypothetical protein
MGFLEKAIALAKDPENQRRAKEALAKYQASQKKKSHGSSHKSHGGIFSDHDEEHENYEEEGEE